MTLSTLFLKKGDKAGCRVYNNGIAIPVEIECIKDFPTSKVDANLFQSMIGAALSDYIKVTRHTLLANHVYSESWFYISRK